MAITVNCACGKKLVVKEEMAGRKVRCPGCDRVQTAPSYSAAPPGRGDYEDDIPPRKARRRYGDAPKKSNTALWIGVGAGVLVLGFCCVGMAGGGVWWLAMRDAARTTTVSGNQNKPADGNKPNPRGLDIVPGPAQGGNADKVIIGNWVPDIEAINRNAQADRFDGRIEFMANGQLFDSTPVSPILNGRWRTLSSKGDSATLELTAQNITFRIDIRVLDNNHLRIVPEDGGEFYFKRAGFLK